MISTGQAVGVGTAVVVAVVLLALNVNAPSWVGFALGGLSVAIGAYCMRRARKEGRPIVSKDPDDYL
jgi:hypothetical protein